jgi:hypothetical protein
MPQHGEASLHWIKKLSSKLAYGFMSIYIVCSTSNESTYAHLYKKTTWILFYSDFVVIDFADAADLGRGKGKYY